MKQILKTLGGVIITIALYLGIRYAFAVIPSGSMIDWDIYSVLFIAFALCVFTVHYSISERKSVYSSILFFVLFISGLIFWSPKGIAGYAIIAGAFIFLMFSFVLLMNNLKDIEKGKSEFMKNASQFLLTCSMYLLILPTVAIGEMVF